MLSVFSMVISIVWKSINHCSVRYMFYSLPSLTFRENYSVMSKIMPVPLIIFEIRMTVFMHTAWKNCANWGACKTLSDTHVLGSRFPFCTLSQKWYFSVRISPTVSLERKKNTCCGARFVALYKFFYQICHYTCARPQPKLSSSFGLWTYYRNHIWYPSSQ